MMEDGGGGGWGGRFGPIAARLAGQACLLIGWRPAQFWDATPAELASVLAAAVPEMGGSGIDRATFNAMLERENDG